MTRKRTIKRPRSDGRCVHCRRVLVEETADHAFPSSWYPDTTPSDVQRWTVPSCADCNRSHGQIEKELFVCFALCIDPQKPAALGLYARAKRSMGIGVTGLSEEEARHREAFRKKVLGNLKPYSSDMRDSIIPGLGPHPETSTDNQPPIVLIDSQSVYAVLRKIARGCEYWLANGRIVEPPYQLAVFVPSEIPKNVQAHMAPFGPVFLGPGLRIRRAGAVDDPLVAFYEFVIWDTMKLLVAILPPDSPGSTCSSTPSCA